MRKIDRLKNEARIACSIRGHKMSKFETLAVDNGPDDPIWARAHCIRCGKEVDVMTQPRPNEIDIGGPALALGCEDAA